MIKVGDIVRHKISIIYFKALKLSESVGTFIALDENQKEVMVNRTVVKTGESPLTVSISVMRLCNCEELSP